jgi:ankyrin repeat protein
VLAKKGANLIEKNKQGDTPLAKAARQGNVKCFKLIVDLLMQREKGSKISKPKLCFVIHCLNSIIPTHWHIHIHIYVIISIMIKELLFIFCA